MGRPRLRTYEQVEEEIERLKNSEAVKLARKEQRIIQKRTAYMNALLSLEKRGKELAADGITMDNMREKLFNGIPEDEE